MGYSDYVQGTGSNGGQMLIRVADSAGAAGVIASNDVKFFVRSGLTATYVYSPGFGTKVYANGGWIQLSNLQNYSNSTDWREVGTINVSTNQTITFHIDYSGTQGFGGPTDFPLAISRAYAPAAPTPIGADQIKHTQFRYRFSGNWDGGSPMLEWQIGYGYDANNVQWTASSNGTIDVGQFKVGSVVYIWSRGRNAVGWGAWSSRTTVQLRRGVLIRSGGVYKSAIPMVRLSKDNWAPFELYENVSGTWKITGKL